MISALDLTLGQTTTFAILVGGALMVLAYWSLGRERHNLATPDQREVDGALVQLSDGHTHYRCWGPPDGHPAVLVSGGTIPCWVWEEMARLMAHAGLRTISYDLYGRGESDRVKGPIDRALYRRQLTELLDAVLPDQTVDLVGVSLGAAIAVDHGARHPNRVRRLVLIAPIVNSWNNPLLKWALNPILGRLFFRVVGLKKVEARAHQFLAHGSDPAALQARFSAQLEVRGTERSLLSLARGDLLGDYRPDYKTVGDSDIDVLMVWADKDPEVTDEVLEEARALLGDARTEQITCGHAAIIEDPLSVAAVLIDFLKPQPMG